MQLTIIAQISITDTVAIARYRFCDSDSYELMFLYGLFL